MRTIFKLYLLLVLGILAFFVGSVLGALSSGRLVLSQSIEWATGIVAIAESVMAFAIFVSATLDGTIFCATKSKTLCTYQR
ncbi:MAG: hypothetical protein ABSF82_03180 [Candidatus Bathyarchaeia archaeon]